MRLMHRLLALPATAALVVGMLAAVGPATAEPGDPGGVVVAERPAAAKGGPKLKVMTQNLYLGSSLDPALEADSAGEFLAAAAQIYGGAVASRFPVRAAAIAKTVARTNPHLIGLQEVTRWTTLPIAAGAKPPSYDFLRILQKALRKEGLSYRVAGVVNNATIGPVPLVAPQFGCVNVASTSSFDCAVTLQDRDVILVRDGIRGLELGKPVTGRYADQQSFPVPGTDGLTLDFGRGWVYVDGTLRGSRFRFLNTHLEIGRFGAVQEAQAAEFLAGPAKAGRPVIATGDFNSPADPRVSTASTYADLTRRWFDDAWAVRGSAPGFTCCQSDALDNPTKSLRTRIDLILTRGLAKPRFARIVGATPIAETAPRWASDHAGVVAGLQLKARKRR
ncbi:endonuclease/exonuclease/phosphatase family protein [Nocardioides ochotonae]|uniref:endonuclease/exonuclease/phosphatase family protein n=1 Tax=Nocardioides ochotonae TaxID=2685869 RepID=UPI0014085755|nr:endonuclease/exonuclease/phosphatase family protein [Nocardioides ochotonae]